MEDEVGISVSSRHRVHPKLLHKEHLVRVLLGWSWPNEYRKANNDLGKNISPSLFGRALATHSERWRMKSKKNSFSGMLKILSAIFTNRLKPWHTKKVIFVLLFLFCFLIRKILLRNLSGNQVELLNQGFAEILSSRGGLDQDCLDFDFLWNWRKNVFACQWKLTSSVSSGK